MLSLMDHVPVKLFGNLFAINLPNPQLITTHYIMKFDPDKMCFGLSEESDRQSFATFLWLSGQPEFAETLATRVSSEEIDTHVTAFMTLLKKHINKDEYHRFFLGETDHNHSDHKE